MKIRRTDRFKKDYQKLPLDIQLDKPFVKLRGGSGHRFGASSLEHQRMVK